MNFLENIQSLIFPPVCGLCKELSNTYLCDECKKRLEQIEQNIETRNCNEYIDRQFWIFEYKDEIRDRLIEYKFGDSSYLYRFFTEIILSNKQIVSYIEDFDYIIPVPLHRKRLKSRGYNQTELISRAIRKKLDITLCNDILKRAKNTKPQSTLEKYERISNIKDAFIVNPETNLEIYKGKKFLIFDDIYTTGATLSECAKILRCLKPGEVGIFTIARD